MKMIKLFTKHCISTILVSITLLTTIVTGHQKVQVGKTGDQPPPGKCDVFMFGGKSRIHVYACCNNCNEKHPSCDGKTYQSASNGTYCDKCGVDNSKGNGALAIKFPCGGCARQNLIDEKCLAKVRKHHIDKPGFCWVYALCFNVYCELAENDILKYSNSTIPDTCFNLQCEPGETTKNCPVDCCGNVSKQCKVDIKSADAMLPKCCTESTCCK